MNANNGNLKQKMKLFMFVFMIENEFPFTVWLYRMMMAEPIEVDACLVSVDCMDIQNKCKQNSRRNKNE